MSLRDPSVSCNTTVMYNVRVNSNREHPPPPQANPDQLMNDESQEPGIWQFIVPGPPGICKQQKT